MARRKHIPPTPEQVAAEAARKAEADAAFQAEWRIIERRVARAILAQPFPLVGQDDTRSGMSAERMQWWGNKHRFELLASFAYLGASDEALMAMTCGTDLYASDRMTAVWWYCARSKYVRREDRSRCGDVMLARFIRQINEIVEDGHMNADIITFLGTGDRFADDRRRARIDLAAQAAEIAALAKGE